MLASVTFSDGSRGHVEVPLARAEMADVRLDDGRSVRIPPHLLVERGPGDYSVPAAPPKADGLSSAVERAEGPRHEATIAEGSLRDAAITEGAPRDAVIAGGSRRDTHNAEGLRWDTAIAETPHNSGGNGEEVVVPVIAETASVQKRTVETGRVRVTKSVSEREELIDEPLLRQDVEVSRTTVGRTFPEAPAVRYEGETIIVPVIEEVLVVEKRYLLKEEIRISRRETETHQPQRVTLRNEDVAVERVPESRTV